MFATVVIVLSISFVHCRSVDDSPQINCYIRHLKNAKKLESHFLERPEAYQVSNCSELIDSYNKKLYQQLASTVLSSIFHDAVDCIISEMKNSNASDDYMKRLVYSKSKLNSVEKQKIDLELKQNIKTTLKNATKSCKAFDGVHRKQFDQYFKLFLDAVKDPLKEYCVRKYVIENKLINTALYNVSLNPTANSTEETCARFLEKFVESFTRDLIEVLKDDGRGFNDGELECFLKKLQKSKFIDKMLVIGVLSEIKISEVQKNAERKSYVEFMANASPYDCVF